MITTSIGRCDSASVKNRKIRNYPFIFRIKKRIDFTIHPSEHIFVSLHEKLLKTEFSKYIERNHHLKLYKHEKVLNVLPSDNDWRGRGIPKILETMFLQSIYWKQFETWDRVYYYSRCCELCNNGYGQTENHNHRSGELRKCVFWFFQMRFGMTKSMEIM